MTDQPTEASPEIFQVITTTLLTETGAALMQLLAFSYVDLPSAQLLIAESLAEPDRIVIRVSGLQSKTFEGIALTPEGISEGERLKQRFTPVPGLCSTSQIMNGLPRTPDKERVVTGVWLTSLASESIEGLNRSFAEGWCPEMPWKPTSYHNIYITGVPGS